MPTSWLMPVDNYCERIDPGFWAEPLNALTNGAFIFAAVYAFLLWRQKDQDWPGLWLIAVTTIIGVGSFLFHTFADRWSLLADVLPIAVFIYSYFWLAMRRYLHIGPMAAVAATLLFAVFNLSFSRLWLGLFPGVTFNGSLGYLPVPAALLTVGLACRTRNMPKAGRALLWAAGLLVLSLVFRSIDDAVCSRWSMGTHFLWHMLNGLVLGILMSAAIAHPPRKRPIHGKG